MIEEDYVTYEVAKLLKEKGFVIPYDSFRGVYINGVFKRLNPGAAYGFNYGDEIISVCSLQMAMKWLRKKYNLYVTAIPNGLGEEVFYPGIYKRFESGWNLLESLLGGFQNAEFSSPEEACEAAIKYCLENLI